MVTAMAKFVVCPHEAGGDTCGFEARSEDEDEVIDRVREHAAAEHDLSLSRSDVETMMEDS